MEMPLCVKQPRIQQHPFTRPQLIALPQDLGQDYQRVLGNDLFKAPALAENIGFHGGPALYELPFR